MGIFGLIVLIDLSLRILNKSNAILAACLHLLATFGLECRAFACKKDTICKKVVVGGGGGGGRGGASALPLPVRRLCVYYLQHFSDAEDGFVWFSEDHRQFLQTRRGICI